MKIFYIIILSFFSCSQSSQQKRIPKSPHPDLKKENLQGAIKKQIFVTYTFIEDSLSHKQRKEKVSEHSFIYDEDGYEKENIFVNDSIGERIISHYDEKHRKVSENFFCKNLKKQKTNQVLTNYVYDTLGYETSRTTYDFLDSLILIDKVLSEYDREGKISTITKYQYTKKKWQPFEKESYKYNRKGYQLEKESSYYYMGLWLLKGKEVNRFEQDSLLIEKLSYNYKIDNSPNRLLYSYDNYLQHITYINSKDSITQVESYLYNRQNKISQYMEYTPQGVEKQRIFYMYTPYGKSLQEIVYNGNSEKERFVYQYDSQGNIIRKTLYQGNKIIAYTEVKYIYYN